MGPVEFLITKFDFIAKYVGKKCWFCWCVCRSPLGEFFSSSNAEVYDSLWMINCFYNKSLSACKWKKRKKEKNAFQKHFFQLALSLSLSFSFWNFAILFGNVAKISTSGWEFYRPLFGKRRLIECVRNSAILWYSHFE